MVIRKKSSKSFQPKEKGLTKKIKKLIRNEASLEQINFDAAGIDIGSRSHFVAVSANRDPEPIREFLTFTGDLQRMADWLKECQITTIVMESTGVYWIPAYELLVDQGFEVVLVNAHYVHNVPGRKTDVLDCQWLQKLHTYGLLSGSFRPSEDICALRAYIRQRGNLVRYASSHTQHMQKALNQMNLQLHHVVSDITGVTGMKIIKAMVEGERDPAKLAKLRDYRCKKSEDTIRKALEGHWRAEHMFSLSQALALYDFYHQMIKECDIAIETHLAQFDDQSAQPFETENKPYKVRDNNLNFDAKPDLYRITGVDLTKIDGLEAHSVLKIVAETGLDMSLWKTEKHFASWLGLCPGNKISGGKSLSGKTKPSANKAAAAFRLAAQGLYNSQSALGAFLRRIKSRLGAPKAITATAHKLAKIFYSMLKNGTEYVDAGQDYYDKQYESRALDNLKRKAKKLGFELVQKELELA